MAIKEFFTGSVVGGSFLVPLFWFLVILLVLAILFVKKPAIRKILGIILGLVLLFLILGSWLSCPISSGAVEKAGKEGFVAGWYSFWNLFRENVLGCGTEVGFFGKVGYYIGDVLGFEQTPGDFLVDFFTGLAAGIMLWLVYLLVFVSDLLTLKTKRAIPSFFKGAIPSSSFKLKSSWLSLIANSPWKAVVFGLLYGVLMQLPFIKVVIEFITFDKVLGFSLGVPFYIRAILIAFYIGFLPGAIEAYSRYKIRKDLYKDVLEVKYGLKKIKTAGSA